MLGDGHIFKSCDLSLKYASHAVSLAVVMYMYTCGDSSMPLLSCTCISNITANGVCLHLLVPPLAQFGVSCT